MGARAVEGASAKSVLRRRATWFWPVVVVVLGVAFVAVPSSRGLAFLYWDNVNQHLPTTKFVRDALLDGQFPQWWSQVGMGFPVFAEGQSAQYSPIRLLIALLFEPTRAIMAELGLYFVLAGLGTYLFVRQLNHSRAAGAIAACSQMFASFPVIFVRNMALHRGLSLLPLAMYFAERFVVRRRPSDLVGMSIVTGLQFLSGHPTFAIVTAVGSATYVGIRVVQRSWQRRRTIGIGGRRLAVHLCGWGFAIAVGFGIAAVQSIPTLLHAGESLRAGGLRFNYAVGSLPARAHGLGMLFVPYAFQHGDRIPDATGQRTGFNTTPNSGLYVGALPIALVLLALVLSRRWSSPTVAIGISWAIATAFAIGIRAGLFPLLWSLPGLGGLRYPHRFLVWSLFCLSVLAGIGFDRIRAYCRQGTAPAWRSLWTSVAGVVFFCLAIGAVSWIVLESKRPEIAESLVLFAIAGVLITLLIRTPRQWQIGLSVLMVGVGVGDLLHFRSKGGYAPAISEAETLRPPDAVQFLRSQPGEFRIMSLVLAEEDVEKSRDLAEAELCTLWDLHTMDAYLSLYLKRHFAVREGVVGELRTNPQAAERLAGFLGAMNVKYVITQREIQLRGWDRVFESAGAVVWSNPKTLPRYYVIDHTIEEDQVVHPEWEERARIRVEHYYNMVADWRTRAADVQIVDKVMNEALDYSTTAVVWPAVLRGSSRVPLRARRVERLAAPTDTMRFAVTSDRAALLVVNESFYPGWRAWVNGRETAIVRTNWLGMGVPISAGASEVVLGFTTPGFRLGVLVSIVSMVVSTAVFLHPAVGSRLRRWSSGAN